MTNRSLSESRGTAAPRADEGALREVEPSALQAVQGGWDEPIPTPVDDPTGGFCGTVPHPFGPLPIVRPVQPINVS
jgi:hypothetical protein